MISKEEHDIQVAVHTFVKYQYRDILAFSIPNEQQYSGPKAALAGKMLNDRGRLAGVADYFLVHPSKGYHGLWIEFKSQKGVQSLSQIAFQEKVEKVGYKYELCRSLEEGVSIISEYSS